MPDNSTLTIALRLVLKWMAYLTNEQLSSLEFAARVEMQDRQERDLQAAVTV